MDSKEEEKVIQSFKRWAIQEARERGVFDDEIIDAVCSSLDNWKTSGKLN